MKSKNKNKMKTFFFLLEQWAEMSYKYDSVN